MKAALGRNALPFTQPQNQSRISALTRPGEFLNEPRFSSPGWPSPAFLESCFSPFAGAFPDFCRSEPWESSEPSGINKLLRLISFNDLKLKCVLIHLAPKFGGQSLMEF
jgi:hypothetical protein